MEAQEAMRLATRPDLIARVRFLLVRLARDVAAEDPEGKPFPRRMGLARTVLHGTNPRLPELMLTAILAHAKVSPKGLDSSDDDLSDAIKDVWDAFSM